MSIPLTVDYIHMAAPGRPLSYRHQPHLPLVRVRSPRYYKSNASCRHFLTEEDTHIYHRITDFGLQIKSSRYFFQSKKRKKFIYLDDICHRYCHILVNLLRSREK